jgi:ribosomal protein S18 acetylase RimI-like enzyme
MARLEMIPFEDAHLGDAAQLLAARHARHRRAEPLLPARFEEPAAARAELESAWRQDSASGSAAFRDGRMVGYLIGAPRPDPVWGDNTWVEFAGHAVEEAEVIRDLYGTAAARWVEEGRSRHYALVPASDSALVESWSRLCFGRQHAHGVREVPLQTEVIVPEGFEIRVPKADEVELLIDVDLALPEHQRSSPVFSGVQMPAREDSRAEWISTLEGDAETILIAVREGRPVACWSVVAVEVSSQHTGLGRPEGAAYLGFASTLPEARGHGVGVALTDMALARAVEEGYRTMVTDWRVTNLLASRFWPNRGFRTSFLRLYRSIP